MQPSCAYGAGFVCWHEISAVPAWTLHLALLLAFVVNAPSCFCFVYTPQQKNVPAPRSCFQNCLLPMELRPQVRLVVLPAVPALVCTCPFFCCIWQISLIFPCYSISHRPGKRHAPSAPFCYAHWRPGCSRCVTVRIFVLVVASRECQKRAKTKENRTRGRWDSNRRLP